MNVSQRKWHYRLHRYLKSCWMHGFEVLPAPVGSNSRAYYYPKSLCTYFWSTVGLVLSTPILALGGVILAVIFALLAGFYFGIFKPWMKYVRAPYLEWARDRRARLGQEVEKERKPREPSMIRQYIKAKKSKVCPTITLVD